MDPYYYPLFSDDIPIFLMCAFLVVITSVQCPYIGEWVPGSPPSGLPGDGGIYWPRKGQNAATIGSHQSQQALVWDDENWMGQLGKLGLISWMWASSPLGHRIPRMEALSSSCKIRIFQSWHCLRQHIAKAREQESRTSQRVQFSVWLLVDWLWYKLVGRQKKDHP